MFFNLIEFCLGKLLFFALHLDGGAFPKPLSKKKQTELFALYRAGDDSARGKLIEHNLRLVAHITKKYSSANADQDDLISIGTIGLIKAVESFNPEKTANFATYASRCIENEILMYFRSLKKSAGDVYFNEPIEVDKDGNALTLIDIVPCDSNIIDIVDLKLKSEQLYKYIAETLDKREMQIISMRYGLFGETPQTQREISAKLGISRSYVSRIEKKALDALRKKFDGA